MLLDVEGSATWRVHRQFLLFSVLCPSSFPTTTPGRRQPSLSVGSMKLTATSAQSVRLVMALSEAGSSLRCEVVSIIDSDVEAITGSVLILI